jgi:hypothetical protein
MSPSSHVRRIVVLKTSANAFDGGFHVGVKQTSSATRLQTSRRRAPGGGKRGGQFVDDFARSHRFWDCDCDVIGLEDAFGRSPCPLAARLVAAQPHAARQTRPHVVFDGDRPDARAAIIRAQRTRLWLGPRAKLIRTLLRGDASITT